MIWTWVYFCELTAVRAFLFQPVISKALEAQAAVSAPVVRPLSPKEAKRVIRAQSDALSR